MNNPDQYGYIVIFGINRAKLYATSMLSAKNKAVEMFKVPKSKQSLIIVALAEKAGKTVEQAIA